MRLPARPRCWKKKRWAAAPLLLRASPVDEGEPAPSALVGDSSSSTFSVISSSFSKKLSGTMPCRPLVRCRTNSQPVGARPLDAGSVATSSFRLSGSSHIAPGAGAKSAMAFHRRSVTSEAAAMLSCVLRSRACVGAEPFCARAPRSFVRLHRTSGGS